MIYDILTYTFFFVIDYTQLLNVHSTITKKYP